MNYKYWTGAHTKDRLKFHLVWILKYQKRVLRGKIVTRLQQLFYQACEINRWWIHKINIATNHFHLVIQVQPRD